MKIFDAHCDVLMKLFLDPNISFLDSEKLQITYQSLQETSGNVQCFAIYVPEAVHPDMRFIAALSMVDIFYEKVLTMPGMKLVTAQKDIEALKEEEIGAVLTLEGCDCIGGDLLKLKTLLRLGVTSVGLTWNFANRLADGAMEKRAGGLTGFGKNVVKTLNQHHIWCDVSHLSEKAFWDVIELADYPIASHSNVHRLCRHPRNLKDDQIKALLKKNGVVGVTFVPQFLTEKPVANISDVIKQIDYIANLGGGRQIGFGSDFDGNDQMVQNISSYRDYSNLINELHKHYPADFIQGILFDNFAARFPKNKKVSSPLFVT
ncbi:membrane dipeptidase [Peribacillus cavernae]|uniref:Membrane dipeptidase n=1 Tax=Peribacillus cavernae TaxID=1674310 RepID=A0A3S0VQD9_9BACI|nr:dipeptidase [Peribacillus cavernae]MDQ0216997.1 membrane dipeptidase [Peribacillus cavernae]RUQ30518.1 membrane dipeptidase [Peribacillus cavernae]